MSDISVALVLLVKNELEPMKKIMPLVDLSLFSDLLCMDGHSTDGSVEFLESRGIRVVRQEVMGRGNAVTESLRHTHEDALLFFSPDGNEDPRDIPKLIEEMQNTNADLVIASRFAPYATSDDSDDPFYVRKIGNLFFTALVRLFWGGGISDAINGYRIIKRPVLDALDQDVAGHQIEIQQTIRCLKIGLNVREIPTIESVRVGGARKSPTYKMGIQFVKLILRELVIGTRFLE